MTSQQLAEALGAAFRAVPPTRKERGLVQVEHVASRTLFVAIAGGTFQMGEGKREIAALAKLKYVEDATREQIAAMRVTAHAVKIAPFLCARAPVLGALAEQVLGDMRWAIGEDTPETGPSRVSPKDAGTLARAFAKDGLRLITDREWEYVAREGGDAIWINGKSAKAAERACGELYAHSSFDRDAGVPTTNALGVWGLPWGEFVAQPTGTRRTAWGIRGGAAMSYPWQSDEVVTCAAAFGYRIGKSKEPSGVRFAIDLPRALLR